MSFPLQVNQHVRLLLVNNITIEGIVEDLETNILIRSLSDNNIVIIPNPWRDIVVIKVLNAPEKEMIKPTSEIKTDLEQEFEDTYNQPSDSDIRLKKLAELRIMMAKQDKKIISEKLKDHHISDVKRVKYGTPRFLPQ